MSLCVPTRNRAASLRETLKELRGQDYPALEIVISDNCSDDDTEQVCRELARQDPRIRYVRHEQNIGLHGNHNFCLDAARGEFICVCHDHDTRHSSIVSEYVAFLTRHPTVGMVCSDWDLINDAGEQLGVREYRGVSVSPGLEYIGRTIRSGRTSIGIPGAMVRASALGSARFVLEAPIGFGDFPLWFRVAETWDVGHIEKILWSWRQNAESHSARPIESVARDYDVNISGYCDDHLTRFPEHQALVSGWRRSIRRYLFWALAYEVGLHFRRGGASTAQRSLFEIMNYRLTPEQFESAVSQMRHYRTSAAEYLVYTVVISLVRLRLTWPLGWLTRHQAKVRTVLGLD